MVLRLILPSTPSLASAFLLVAGEPNALDEAARACASLQGEKNNRRVYPEGLLSTNRCFEPFAKNWNRSVSTRGGGTNDSFPNPLRNGSFGDITRCRHRLHECTLRVADERCSLTPSPPRSRDSRGRVLADLIRGRAVGGA